MFVFQKFAEAAKAASCGSVTFSQMTTLSKGDVTGQMDGAGGICHGLSMVWLARKAKGDASESILRSLGPTAYEVPRQGQLSPLASIARNMNREQNAQDYTTRIVAQTGLSPALAKDDNGQKSRQFCLSHENVEIGAGGAEECVKWLGAAAGRRYFMISIDNFHSMAAVGSKLGGFEFFDPNGGVASTSKSTNMVSLFTTWFGSDDRGVYSAYKGQGGASLTPNRVVATLLKYKVSS